MRTGTISDQIVTIADEDLLTDNPHRAHIALIGSALIVVYTVISKWVRGAQSHGVIHLDSRATNIRY